jgi:hypothetical protein
MLTKPVAMLVAWTSCGIILSVWLERLTVIFLGSDLGVAARLGGSNRLDDGAKLVPFVWILKLVLSVWVLKLAF